MNHRIFERTLRPLVFHGACLFERHLYPQALLGVGRFVFARQRLALKRLAADLLVSQRSTILRLQISKLALHQEHFLTFDLGSGRDTR